MQRKQSAMDESVLEQRRLEIPTLKLCELLKGRKLAFKVESEVFVFAMELGWYLRCPRVEISMPWIQ